MRGEGEQRGISLLARTGREQAYCPSAFPQLLIPLLQMHQPAALHRISVGIPATLEHSSHPASSGAERAQSVAETTQAFITFMDALKLKLRAKDQLHPLLGDLMGAYGKAGGAAEGRGKLVGW